MIKRLNYTGRRRIRREDVLVRIIANNDQPPVFEASLSLGRYRLPADALVFVEAYRQTAWQRFDFGTVGGLRAPDDRRLTAFGAAEGVQFRIKVVEAQEPDGDARPARILGHADRIRPRAPEEGQARSLLPLDPGDFRDEVWRLEFDETDQPVLKVSRYLVPDWRTLPGTREFIPLALPAIFRSILTRIVLVHRHVDLEDGRDWKSQWLRFTVQLPGVDGGPPDPQKDDADQWIEDAVEAFSRRVRIASRFQSWWKEV